VTPVPACVDGATGENPQCLQNANRAGINVLEKAISRSIRSRDFALSGLLAWLGRVNGNRACRMSDRGHCGPHAEPPFPVAVVRPPMAVWPGTAHTADFAGRHSRGPMDEPLASLALRMPCANDRIELAARLRARTEDGVTWDANGTPRCRFATRYAS